jgi:hypothetical protein
MKICDDFAPNFDDNAPSDTSFFTREFFYQKQHGCRTQPYCSLFPRLKIKLKGRHFDTIGVIETDSQAVLIATFRMHLKHVKRAGTSAYAWKEIVASRSKVSFRPDGSTSPENYGWLFV